MLLSKKINIRVLNVVAIVSAVTILVISLTLANVRLETKVLQSRSMDSSIVRLHDASTGRFFCSGVIISTTRMLTAAHCVIRESFFGIAKLESVEIRLQDNKPINLIATVEAANPRQDLAVLKGDFRGFDSRPVITNSSVLNDIFLNKSSKIVACGFPNAGPLRCSRLINVGRAIFFFAANGFLYPGMSGGPVIDLKTGSVIAVNQAVTEDGRAIVSPLIELFDQLGLNESPDKQ